MLATLNRRQEAIRVWTILRFQLSKKYNLTYELEDARVSKVETHSYRTFSYKETIGGAMHVIRISKNKLINKDKRIKELRAYFGLPVELVDKDLPYNVDPVEAVKSLLSDLTLAVEIESAPVSVISKLLEPGGIKLPFIRPVYRDPVTTLYTALEKESDWREGLSFSFYELLDSVRVMTRPLNQDLAEVYRGDK